MLHSIGNSDERIKCNECNRKFLDGDMFFWQDQIVCHECYGQLAYHNLEDEAYENAQDGILNPRKPWGKR